MPNYNKIKGDIFTSKYFYALHRRKIIKGVFEFDTCLIELDMSLLTLTYVMMSWSS
jgi:hypothetical protein